MRRVVERVLESGFGRGVAGRPSGLVIAWGLILFMTIAILEPAHAGIPRRLDDDDEDEEATFPANRRSADEEDDDEDDIRRPPGVRADDNEEETAEFTLRGPPPPRPPTGPTKDELTERLASNRDILAESQGKEPMREGIRGCVQCHEGVSDPHATEHKRFPLACVECHGGNGNTWLPKGAQPGSEDFERIRQEAHVMPRNANWPRSANPERSYTDLLKEDTAFVRFMNPGDLRVVEAACGECHQATADHVGSSMMNHGAMLWGAALYNNGAVSNKNARFGAIYGPDGKPQALQMVPPPTARETREDGILPFLEPVPRWEVSQPGNILRVFERGGRRKLEVGLPSIEEENGRPDKGLSPRGLGTLNRTDPVFLGIQKTRLHNPTLNMLGTNDHPGDYRSSGCTACHMVYANDRNPLHSGPFARFGNRGTSHTADPMIPKGESGHPVRHKFTNAIPSSQCMVCHMHPGTNVMNTYFGYTWWDNETDGEHMYPKKQRYLKPEQAEAMREKNPEESSLKGLWSDPEFLANLTDLNPKLKNVQFADFHGHGWVFRAVYKKDRKGNFLDENGKVISYEDPEKFEKAVHLKDIHLEKGMHCIDCHFSQDNHGNGKLYGETRNAIEITCEDCHGSVTDHAWDRGLVTSGPAAPQGGTSLRAVARTPYGQKRFEKVYDPDLDADILKQRSMVTEGVEWTVVQVKDIIDPGSSFYNEKARLAKTIHKDGKTWGNVDDKKMLAHMDTKVSCFACHTSWMTSCFGCHLPMKANKKKPNLHNEGRQTRNWTGYNYQVVRDDVFMLGIDGTVTGNRVAPVRSSSAVVVSSQTGNREWVYSQQQTVSAEGYSGQAFNTHVPHTVRTRETKGCTDCHLSRDGDNNAIIAQLFLQGTNFVNFMGRYVYVGEGHEGLEAVAVTEHDEPQAVYGSHLHQLAYPDRHREHLQRHGELEEAYHHHGSDIRSLQLRGEYLYTTSGADGLVVFDVAQIDNKGFSERIVTSPVSPMGQRTQVRSRNATAVALPSTLYVDPARPRRPENEERPPHDIYRYAFVADSEEGLILVDTRCLIDGDPRNNFLSRALTWNPDGVLTGARGITIAGNYACILTSTELVIVDLSTPLAPRLHARVGEPTLEAPTRLADPTAIAIQFRYAFVTDRDGLKVIALENPANPTPRIVGTLPITGGAMDVYLARTYAYVAAGSQGLVIVDIERPEFPTIDQIFNGDGRINDARAVRVGMTNASLYAYIADGHNGLQVVQLTDSSSTPGSFGFSPRVTPRWIARHETHGPAIALSKGLDRDRAVDESGNQVAVFGRRGSRPFNRAEMESMYFRDGKAWSVTDGPPGPPIGTPEWGSDPGSHGSDDDYDQKETLFRLKFE